MSGYKCVQFSDLCRLCTSSTGTKIQVFSEEGLCKKINESLSVLISDRDKLPKLICSICMESVQQISEYRQTCIKAQKMLESCLNTSKLQNGGQVYIKDEQKKVLTIQNQPSAGKLQGNKISIITTNPQQMSTQTPVVLQQHQKITKKGSTPSSGSDFLSSIMQAVGIQTSDDTPPLTSPTTAQQTIQPQYTLTLDGQTFKTGKIQYKIENAGSATRTVSIETPSILQQQSNSQVDEFLKLKSNVKVTNKKENQQQKDSCGSKTKKPKINLFVQTTPVKQQQQQQPKQATPQIQKSVMPLLNTPNKSGIQIQDIKIIPSTSMQNSNIITASSIQSMQTTPKKQYMMPIVLNKDGTIGTKPNTDTQQLITQALQAAGNQNLTVNNANTPVAYLQMKIQQNADGQSFHLAPANMQTTLTLSPQQLQQFSFHSNPQQLTHQVIQAPPVIKAPPVIQQNQTTQIDDDEDDDENYGGDHQFVLEVEDESLDDSNLHRLGKEEDLNTSASSTSMNNSFPAKQMKAENALSPKSLTKLQNQQQQHSETAKKQLKRMSSHSIKHQSDAVQKSTESTLTTCEVCQKTFKRKEHLTQHLKSHVGLRPFKCDEPQCNKSFSRKEHLIRHVVSHTGEKMFRCDFESCNKLFSRKDNLNKHRRIHPESAQTGDLSCEVCGKTCVSKSQLARHQATHSTNATVELKQEPREKPTVTVKTKTKPALKKVQKKIDKPKSPVFVDAQPESISQHPHQQIVVLDQGMFQQQKLKQDPHSSQIMQFQLAMPMMNPQQASLQQQQQNKALIKAINAAVSSGETQTSSGATIYSLPSNLILNSGSFMTNTGDFDISHNT